MAEVLVIDIGGTKTNLSFLETKDSQIELLSSDILHTESNPELLVQKIESCYKSKGKQVDLMLLSLPGRWDKNGVLCESYFLHSWLGYPFVQNLKSVLKINDCFWETDVICAALGEYRAYVGNSRDRSLLYINLGTGIGAAFIHKGGEPYKSSKYLTLRMQKLVLSFQDELFSGVDLISGGSLLEISKYNSISDLYKDYKQVQIEAVDIISGAQTQLAVWLVNLFYLFAPDVIVLGGGLTFDWEVLAEGAIDIAREELEDQVEILPGKLKEMAPIYGAYLNYSQQVSKSVSLQS